MKKVLNAALIAILVAPVAGLLARDLQAPRVGDAASRARGDAAWREGLHAQAVAAGGHYFHVTSWESELQFDTVDTLFHRSDVVVLGDVLEGWSHLSKHGDYVTTDYRLHVQQVFKGNLNPNSVAVLQVMGGKYIFDDGTDVQIETRGFARPIRGDRIVVFGGVVNGADWLSPGVINYAGGIPILSPTAGSRGVVTVPNNDTDKVRVNDVAARDPMSHTLRMTSVGVLIADLQRLANSEKRQ